MDSSLLEQQLDVSEPLQAREEMLAPRGPSYQATAWTPVNRLLDIVDTYTGGRAAICQRFFSFAFIGGIAAIVNIAVFYYMFDLLALPVNDTLRNVIASVVAAEISIMANFQLNDFFTFRRLAGHQRTWIARGVRFHITAVGGSVLIFAIQFALSHLLHMRPIFGQVIALILVLFYNFTLHHVFTYRQVKPAANQVSR
jgi:putative flippase GtrA